MKTIRDERRREALVERINGLRSDATPRWGRMNAEQMLSHLVQGSELPFVASVPMKSTWAMRNVVKPLVLYVLPMPKEVKISAAMDQQKDGRRPLGFDTDRALVIELLNRLGTLPATEKCLDHPMFGKMSANEWGVIAHKHVDHHLRQFGV